MVLQPIDIISECVQSFDTLQESDIIISLEEVLSKIEPMDEGFEEAIQRSKRNPDTVNLYNNSEDGSYYVEYADLSTYMEANEYDIETALINLSEHYEIDQDLLTVLVPSLEAVQAKKKEDKDSSTKQLKNVVNKGIPVKKCNETSDIIKEFFTDEQEEIVQEVSYSTVSHEKFVGAFRKLMSAFKSDADSVEQIDKRIEKLKKMKESQKDMLQRYKDHPVKEGIKISIKTFITASTYGIMGMSVSGNISPITTVKILGIASTKIKIALAAYMALLAIGNAVLTVKSIDDIIKAYKKETNDAIKYLENLKKEKLKEEKNKSKEEK